MSYSTASDIEMELGTAELVRLTNAGGETYNVLKILAAIDFADLTINAYLGARLETPLPAARCGILRKISKDLAIYNLYEGACARTSPPTGIVWKRQFAMEMLEKVQSGDLRLPQNPGSVPAIIHN